MSDKVDVSNAVKSMIKLATTDAEVSTVLYNGDSEDGVQVMMLHGAAFEAQTWIDIGVDTMLADAGLKVAGLGDYNNLCIFSYCNCSY